MRMGDEDTKEFPECAKLLRNVKTNVKPDVIKAFIEACTSDDLRGAKVANVKDVAQKALQWGNRPTVQVGLKRGELLVVPAGGDISDACGFTDTFPGHPSFVLITHIWFEAYETCNDTDRPAAAARLLRTVLHETVHWVRDQVGAEDDVTVGGYYKGKSYEGGHYFETLAYGTENVCTEAEVKAAKGSIRLRI